MFASIKTFFKNHSKTISNGAKVAGAVAGVATVAAGGYVAYKHYKGTSPAGATEGNAAEPVGEVDTAAAE